MIAPALVAQVADAIDFIFRARESVSGNVQVGGAEFIGLGFNHMVLSIGAMLLAMAIALPIGLYLGHVQKAQFLAVSTSNVGRAVPVLALQAFFLASLGANWSSALVALTLLAIPPILTTAYVGISQAEPGPVDAARGMGLSEGQVLRRVELPMALPTIFTGLRTSFVAVVATATIAPLANYQTLGTPILEPQTYGQTGIAAAAILVALITLLSDAALKAIQEAVLPRGLKLAAGRSPSSGVLRSFLRRRTQPA